MKWQDEIFQRSLSIVCGENLVSALSEAFRRVGCPTKNKRRVRVFLRSLGVDSNTFDRREDLAAAIVAPALKIITTAGEKGVSFEFPVGCHLEIAIERSEADEKIEIRVTFAQASSTSALLAADFWLALREFEGAVQSARQAIAFA